MDTVKPWIDPKTFLPNILPEEANGIWVGGEGEEDTTVRPASDPEAIRRMKAEWLEMNQEAKPMPSPRTGEIERVTGETKIRLKLNLDGSGLAAVETGIGFFDHMLTLLAKHGLMDLTVRAEGDLHVDAHHTVEDVGICFGKALVQALGDKAGIRRYGSATLPMDETLVTAAIDLSGRPFCVWRADVPAEMLGTFNAPLAEEFWRAVASSGLLNLHVLCHHGKNAHHIVEAIFKSCARALRQAVENDPRTTGVPSTKGVL
jgi:imidazoleglycerol-phosphate dehydratase